MTRVNKILLLFLVIISTSFLGMWEFLQSEFLANLLSKTATKYSKNYLGAELNFEKITFRLFPPAVELNNVEMEKSGSTGSHQYIQVSSLGMSFNPLDIFKTDLTIDRIYLIDGVVKVSALASASSETENSISSELEKFKVSETINLIRSKLPVSLKKIEFNKIKINYNKNSLVTHYASLNLKEDNADLNLILRDFNLNKLGIWEEVLDEVSLNLNISDQKIRIENLKLTKNMNSFFLNGDISNYTNLELMEFDTKGSLQTQINELHNYIDIEKIGKLKQGMIQVHFEGMGRQNSFRVNADLLLERFNTDFAFGDKAKAKIKLTEEKIIFDSFELQDGRGELKIIRPFEFFNFTTRKFIEENILAEAKNLRLQNALVFLEDNLGILHGDLSGNVEFHLGEKDFQFLIKQSKVENLKLVTDENKSPILDVRYVNIPSAQFEIVGSNVDIGMDIAIENSQFKVRGEIKNSKVKFDVVNGRIDLEEIGKIAGMQLKGLGPFSLIVNANEIEKKLVMNCKLKQFSFEEYSQDSVESKISLDFNKNSLSIENVKAQTGSATTKAEAIIGLGDLSVNAKIKLEKLSVSEISRMYSPVLKNTGLSQTELFGDWSTEAEIKGYLELSKMKIKGSFVGLNNYLYGESFDLVKFDYSLAQANFSLSNVFFSKANGEVQGGLKYDIIKQDMIFWGSINKVPLMEVNNFNKIPMNLKGYLSGLFKGSIKNEKLSLNSEFNINKSTIHNKKIGDSYLKLSFQDGNMNYDLSLLGNQLLGQGNINLGTQTKNSNIKWRIKSDDLNESLAIFSFVDHLRTGFTGKIDLEGEALFNIGQIEKITASLYVNELFLNKGPLQVEYLGDGSDQIQVKEGRIEKWNLKIRGKKFYVISNGEGDISKDFDIKTRLKVDAVLLELFNVLISKAGGTLLGDIHHFRKNEETDYVAKLISNNISLSSDFMPLSVNNGELVMSYKKKKVILNKLKAQLNNGNFLMNGSVDIAHVIPEINLRYEFKNAGIPILKKSSIVFSGKGSIVGKTIPYGLGGDIQIQKFNIVNEITDFAGSEKIIREDFDYLPQDISQVLNQFLNFNINISTLAPIRITNSMADLGFSGNLILTGGEKDPRLEGKIALAAGKNQIFFKNNVFNLTKGNVFFYERNKISNPELDFQATSAINKYNVMISVLGPLYEFKLDLKSDPALAQSDILSLIAFGYTEDLSTNLSDIEKESMTRAGVGSIIFDRFKINETLKNEFGLQINLGTQITQEEGSYLSQRNAEGAAVGRVRSATTIEVKKQISEAMGLSVTSTVGGTVGQRQSMNLNYNLNKNLSIEGVYQSNTEFQSEELNNDSSLGADIKIRWSFK